MTVVIVTIANWKGGVGKTTTAVYLGVALEQYGTVRLVDGDPQRSLAGWARMAGSDFPPVVEVPGSRLTRDLAGSVDWLLIDTPPGDPLALGRAVDSADLVLIPTRASHGDVNRTLELADALGKQGTPATVLIVGAQAGTRVLEEVRSVLTDDLPAGITLYEHAVPFRQHYLTAYGSRPRKRDLHPFDLLAHDIKES